MFVHFVEEVENMEIVTHRLRRFELNRHDDDENNDFAELFCFFPAFFSYCCGTNNSECVTAIVSEHASSSI